MDIFLEFETGYSIVMIASLKSLTFIVNVLDCQPFEVSKEFDFIVKPFDIAYLSSCDPDSKLVIYQQASHLLLKAWLYC